MGTQLIEYSYSGDEEAWRNTLTAFLDHIASDPVLKDSFSYTVFVSGDGVTRRHVPVWRDETVLDRLRAQPFFKEFTAAIQGFAGDSLKVTKPVMTTLG